MSSHSSSSAPSPKPNTLRLLNLLPSLSKTNAHLAHLHRLTLTTAHLDALLSTIYYTLSLLSTIPRLSTDHISTTALLSLLSTLRLSLRLTGLLPLHAWAVSLVRCPPRDPLLRAVAWTQVLANVAYQVLENGAFLADRGVLRRWGFERRRAAWAWSGRMWMVHVGLEGVRLGREWMVRNREEEEQEVKAAAMKKREQGLLPPAVPEVESHPLPPPPSPSTNEKSLTLAIPPKPTPMESDDRWWREAIANLAYFPLTVHWSFEERGLLGDRAVAVLGIVAGGVGLRMAWRETGTDGVIGD